MSTMTAANPAQFSSTNYLANVAAAARDLLAAIFAVKTAKTSGETSIGDLYRMAASYDSVMPNLAQELRAIALRA